MKQAKPSNSECLAFLHFIQGLESIIENGECPDPEGERFDARNAEEILGWLCHKWRDVGPIWQRVFFAGQTCIENACDPNANTLEWKPELKRAAEMADILKEISATCCSFQTNEPVEQPTEDGPWLPCGLMSRIYEVIAP